MPNKALKLLRFSSSWVSVHTWIGDKCMIVGGLTITTCRTTARSLTRAVVAHAPCRSIQCLWGCPKAAKYMGNLRSDCRDYFIPLNPSEKFGLFSGFHVPFPKLYVFPSPGCHVPSLDRSEVGLFQTLFQHKQRSDLLTPSQKPAVQTECSEEQKDT